MRRLATATKQVEMLKVLQSHPELMKNTTIKGMVGKMLEQNLCGENVADTTLSQIIYKLMKRGALKSSGEDGTTKSRDFWINYYLPEMPQSILDGMTDEERIEAERTKKRAEEQLKRLDDDGVMSYSLPKEETDDPFSEDDSVGLDDIENPWSSPDAETDVSGVPLDRDLGKEITEQLDTQRLLEKIQYHPSPEPAQTTIPVQVERNGQNLSITININLNN